MNRNSVIFLYIAGMLAICSFLFFLGLVVHLPFGITCGLSLLAGFAFVKFISKNISFESVRADKYFLRQLVLITGFAAIGYKSVLFSEKWGGWDAWCIWNLHAKFIVSGNDWQNMFHRVLEWTHPDYPLMLPGIDAMGTKIVGDNLLIVPYTITLLFTLCTAGFVYTEIASKHLVAGIAVMAAFVFNDVFITEGALECADILVAFFYLATIVTLHHYQLSKKPVFIALSSFFIICALWSKNEAAICAIVVLLVYAKDFLSKKNIPGVLAVIIIPGLIWLVFKLYFAPANDLTQQKIDWVEKITNAESYRIIIDAFYQNTKQHFPGLLAAWVITGISAIFLKKFINRKFIALLLITVVCQASYLITPYGLEWHVITSQNRLILQVFPSFIFIAGLSLANVINRFTGLAK